VTRGLLVLALSEGGNSKGSPFLSCLCGAKHKGRDLHADCRCASENEKPTEERKTFAYIP
jgi:phosphoribosyl 1,2-cyclic phosphodiesterase